MIPAFFAIHTITIHPATSRNELGHEVRTWGEEPDRIVSGCFIRSGPSTEILTREEAEVTEFTVSMPPGTRVSRRDRISFEYGGEIYGGSPDDGLEITGPPRRPSGPIGYLDRVAIGVTTQRQG